MAIISKFVTLALFTSLFYFIGLLSFLTNNDGNKCEMTYMFEYPQFVKIKVPIEDQIPRYGLFAYCEGRLIERTRAMIFDGIPVLYVPGHAGSYKQVRSLASVALRKALHSRVEYHFDFFTIDLNGELSALNGALLDSQSMFLNHSLNRILNLYDKKKANSPNSVIIIGHSMGGVLAHNIITDPETSDNVDLLITIASPHNRPFAYIDKYMSDFYSKVSENSLIHKYNLERKTLITIGAGFHDLLVHSAQTNSNFSSLNVISTEIPKVWLSMEHPVSVWCKQFVLTIIRALFDSVDLKTRQLSIDPNYRLTVFKHHLIKNSGINIRSLEHYKVKTKLDDRGDWREDLRRLYTISNVKGTQKNQWHMVRILTEDPKHRAVFIQAVNLALTDWIFACNAALIRGQSRYCDTGFHLSHLSKIAPSNNLKRRTHFVNLVKLKQRYPEITHLVVRIPPTEESIFVHFDVHNPAERIINVNLPRWFSLSKANIIQRTEPKTQRYELHLPGLQHVIQSFLLYVEVVECSEDIHHATVSFSVPWGHHDTHAFITESLKKPLLLRLHSSRPLQKSNTTAKVILTLDPACQYSVSVRNSFIGMISQFARFYSPLLIANIAAVILMSYRSQLTSLEENGYCTLFQSSLSMSTKPYYLVTTAKLISKVLTMVRLPGILPVPDTQILISENIDFLVLPLLLYVTSVGIVYIFSLLFWAAIIMNESTVHKILGKFFTRAIGSRFKMYDWVINAMHRIPCVVAATLAGLGMTTCGSLGLCLGVAYYFLKLTQLCQDYLEGLAYGYAKIFVSKVLNKIINKFKKTNVSPPASEPKSEHNEQIEESNKQIEETNKQIEETNKQIKNTDNKSDQQHSENSKSKLDQIENDIKEARTNIRKRKVTFEASNHLNFLENKTEKNQETETKSQESLDDNGDSIDHSEMHFHFTLFLIWILVSALNIPYVLTWAHNFQYNNILSPDPSNSIGFILCLCAIPLWQLEFPRTNKKYYNFVSIFVYIMALCCLISAPINIYRLSYILTAVIVVTLLHQLFAPNKSEDENERRESPRFDPVELFKIIKSKLE